MKVNEFEYFLKLQRNLCLSTCDDNTLYLCVKKCTYKIEKIDCKLVITNLKTNKISCTIPSGFKIGKCC